MLYEFYGETCPHCVEMMPTVDKLIAEGLPFEKHEVWNSEENATLMKDIGKGRCPGVPFFINMDSDQWVCGSTDEATLRKLAAGETIAH